MFDLPMLVFLSILSMACSVALAYVVLGITGFGSALVAVPLLLLRMPLAEVVPLVLLLDVLAFTVFGALNFAHIDWLVWRRVLPSMAIGVIAAAISQRLGLLPETWLLLLLGLYITGFGGLKLRLELNPSAASTDVETTPLKAPPAANTASFWRLFPFGWAAGVIETWFGTCGPIVVAGVLAQTNSMSRFKATTSAIILPASLMALSTYLSTYVRGYSASSEQTHTELIRTLWLAPIAVGAVWLGNRLSNRLPQDAIRRAVFALLCISGGLLIFKALRSL